MLLDSAIILSIKNVLVSAMIAARLFMPPDSKVSDIIFITNEKILRHSARCDGCPFHDDFLFRRRRWLSCTHIQTRSKAGL